MTKLSFNSFFPPEVLALVSGRDVDFSLNDASPRLTKDQIAYFLITSGTPVPDVFNIRQVHESTVVEVTPDNWKDHNKCIKADAVITRGHNLPLAVRTADCLSVFIFDPESKGIGLVHAGWRGTKEEIVSKTLAMMKEKWQSNPADLKVAFGPAIRSCCYEVGKEFKEYFPAETHEKDGKVYFDLIAANKKQLTDAGVQESNIFDSGVCTQCDGDCFSYRREGERAGRMISFMLLK